jgi:signal peptidase I
VQTQSKRWWVVAFVLSICVVVAAAVLIEQAGERRLSGMRTFKIPSSGMAPALLVGDYLIAERGPYSSGKPIRGDIAVFAYPEDTTKFFIKRIVGLGGEKLEIKNKTVFINGKPLEEPYKINRTREIYPAEVTPRDNFGPATIPEDSVFLMGDNRDHSHDSRFWGCVMVKDLEYRALYIYLSKTESGEIRWDRIGAAIK